MVGEQAYRAAQFDPIKSGSGNYELVSFGQSLGIEVLRSKIKIIMKLFVLLTVFAACIFIAEGRLTERFVWNELQFDWPSAEVKQAALNSEKYVPKHNLPLGLDVWRNKLFITVPRWKHGIAATLGYVSLDGQDSLVHAYPNWEANTLPVNRTDQNSAFEDARIISTFRIRVDECDRLWVMDTGLADILGSPSQFKPPSLVIFDLNTDKLIRRFTIPEDQVKEDTFFANVNVDITPGQCINAFAYVPDLGAYGVVVYSFKEDKSWRVKHNFFHFDPLNGDYNVGGVNFQWTDGVFSLAMGKPQPDGSRPVYFHALSSTKEFMVSNLVLQNETYATSEAAYFDYKLLGDKGPNSQTTASFYDPTTGVLFYSQVNKDAIGCWNTNKPFNADTQGLIDSNSETLVFPNDLKVDSSGNLWVLSDRMPVYLFGKWDDKLMNYRVLTGKSAELIKGTPCQN